jgi:hypothetical protein
MLQICSIKHQIYGQVIARSDQNPTAKKGEMLSSFRTAPRYPFPVSFFQEPPPAPPDLAISRSTLAQTWRGDRRTQRLQLALGILRPAAIAARRRRGEGEGWPPKGMGRRRRRPPPS